MDGKARVITVTPTISTNIYAAGDQLGTAILTLPYAADTTSDTVTIMSLVVCDKSSQNAALDLLFFNAAPTLISSDNAAFNISDADHVAKFIGRIKVLASDYTSNAAQSDATVLGVGLMFQATTLTDSLYCIAVSQGTGTYTSTSDLTFKIGILQD